jgi:hypothetical protein
MKFSFNTCYFFLLIAAACNAVTTSAEDRINLGDACGFAVLAKSGISTVPPSAVTGNIGVSPIAATAMTGFSMTADSTKTHWTSSQVNGICMAADDAVPSPATMTAAVSAMEAAYTAGNNRLATFPNNLARAGAAMGTIGGVTLYPGVYKFTVVITIDTDITFDAMGDPDAQFTVTTTDEVVLASDKNVRLAGGAKAENIYWHVAGYVQIGTGAHMEGNIMCYTKIVLNTGSSLNGRAMAQTAVTLQMARVNKPAGCGELEEDEEEEEENIEEDPDLFCE